MSDRLGIIILAAGKGKRMGGVRPKVLFRLGEKTLIDYVVRTAVSLNPSLLVAVIGFGGEKLRAHLSGVPGIRFAVQEEQRGTGHAVRHAGSAFRGFSGAALVLNGDTPLISAGTLRSLVAFHRKAAPAATVMTADYDNPSGYGRILRDGGGKLLRIVEEKDASASEKRITEVNTGTFVFDAGLLFRLLPELQPDNAQHELYITDMVAILRERGHPVGAWKTRRPEETYGVNAPGQLEALNRMLKAP